MLPDKKIEIINTRFLKPLDEKTIIKSIEKTKHVITIEDNLLKGGLASAVLETINKNKLENIKIKTYGYDDIFIEHGTVEELEDKYGLTAKTISKDIQNI